MSGNTKTGAVDDKAVPTLGMIGGGSMGGGWSLNAAEQGDSVVIVSKIMSSLELGY
jgi:hypothetical protein